MNEPQLSATTERIWQRLPEYVRIADAGDWRLKTWLSGVTERLAFIVGILERFETSSALTNAEVADASWLPWLAQLVGVTLAPSLSDAERRNAIAAAATGWRAATKAAIAYAARTELTGTKYAAVYDHSTSSAGGVGTGTMWDVLIVTRTTETPSSANVLAAVERQRAKPAGVTLWWRAYAASWDTIQATFSSWRLVESSGWDRIEEAGLT